MTLTRRALLRGTAAATGLGLVGLGTTGCSGITPGRDGGGSLDYWNLFGGGDGVRMTQMLDTFRTANPGIALSAVTLAWGNPYYTKLSLATLGDKPPDVAISHLTRMKTLVASDLLEELRPEDLGRHGITADKFTPRAWQAGLVEGRAYGLPLDTHPFVMFYNTDICAKAGLLDAAGALTPLDTPDKFTDAMRRAKEASGAYGGVVSINGDTSTPWRIFQSLYSQLGGETLADEGRRVVIDDAKATQVLTFLQSLTADGLFPADIDYQGAIATFANGQAGFYFQGEWEISTYQTAKMPFSMTLFPNLYGGARYAVQADSHTLVIPRQPGRDPEQIDRALLLIRSMLDQSKTWAEGGHVPTWLPFRDSAEYQAMTPQSNYASAADGAVYDPDGWYSGSGSNFEIVTGSAIATVLGGQQSPADALAQMRGQLETLSTTASPI
ncbi:extracellular solute-binding protein [Amorphoplanes digitatis]|uniref:Multiple sugar transport system substrate-binding protein n=1 Tax=Actinoplanes digitatis TaxID=1868 RepID=A0A7W7HV51_9ACTN|nr:extracellular solute-binding protein [Actinoplanes digitatis]MBB4761340.1 multiple sugar transport system substrate-binding protein [Actinoplanes digitatis]GID92957.1 sugar ABC transporter substrate-binding protein [Actinoplanes digitatis]